MPAHSEKKSGGKKKRPVAPPSGARRHQQAKVVLQPPMLKKMTVKCLAQRGAFTRIIDLPAVREELSAIARGLVDDIVKRAMIVAAEHNKKRIMRSGVDYVIKGLAKAGHVNRLYD